MTNESTTPAGEREATSTEPVCENGAAPYDCASVYNCCDCGNPDSRFACCDYCWSCNACNTCR